MNDPSVPQETAVFVVEPAEIGGWLDLLAERQADEQAKRIADETYLTPLTRRAVYVGRYYDQRGSQYGFPHVTRYVLASYIYSSEIVRLKRITSSEIEFPNTHYGDREHPADIHDRVYKEIVGEIRTEIINRRIEGVEIIEGRVFSPKEER